MSFQVQFNKTFLKELYQIPLKQRIVVERFVFEEIIKIDSVKDIPNINKLKGFRYYYRIRFGNYRAGVSIKNNTLTFERLLHRKDIYKYFP